MVCSVFSHIFFLFFVCLIAAETSFVIPTRPSRSSSMRRQNTTQVDFGAEYARAVLSEQKKRKMFFMLEVCC